MEKSLMDATISVENGGIIFLMRVAGHVIVEDFVTIGGMTPVHQKVRIGKYSMVGGFSRVTQDIPPFTIGAGYIYKLAGLNLIGLRRNGFSLEKRQEKLKESVLL